MPAAVGHAAAKACHGEACGRWFLLIYRGVRGDRVRGALALGLSQHIVQQYVWISMFPSTGGPNRLSRCVLQSSAFQPLGESPRSAPCLAAMGHIGAWHASGTEVRHGRKFRAGRA